MKSINNPVAYRKAREAVRRLELRVSMLTITYERTEALAFKEFKSRFYTGNRSTPVNDNRTAIKLKLFDIKNELEFLTNCVKDYERRKKIHLISDCYRIVEDGNVLIFIVMDNNIKEKKFFTYPLNSGVYMNPCDLVGKTMEEAMELKFKIEKGE